MAGSRAAGATATAAGTMAGATAAGNGGLASSNRWHMGVDGVAQMVAELRRLALDTPPWTLLGWSPATPGRLNGRPLAQFVNVQLDGRALQALPTPMVCAVQRLRDGSVIGFTRGDAGVAVQAAQRGAQVEAGHVPHRGRTVGDEVAVERHRRIGLSALLQALGFGHQFGQRQGRRFQQGFGHGGSRRG